MGIKDIHSKTLAAVSALQLPERLDLSAASFAGIGYRTERRAHVILQNLASKHGDTLPDVMGISGRLAAYAAYRALFSDRSMSGGTDSDFPDATPAELMEDLNQFMSTGNLVDYLDDFLSPADGCEWRQIFPFDPKIIRTDVFECLAIQWLIEAAKAARHGNVEAAFDLLHDANCATALADALDVYVGGREVGKVDQKVEHKAAMIRHAKKAAAASHKESTEGKEKIRRLWANGEYRNRTDCSRQEAKDCKLEFQAARRALQGQPDPNPWPAKNSPEATKETKIHKSF